MIGREILRHQARRDEGERLAVYGAQVCGELLDEALWFYGITGDQGAGGATFQRGGQLRSAGGEPCDRLDGAIGERARGQIQESRVLTLPSEVESNAKRLAS